MLKMQDDGPYLTDCEPIDWEEYDRYMVVGAFAAGAFLQ